MSFNKDTVILLLLIVILLLFTRPDMQDSEDPDFVTIEYQCSDLAQYENVPPEVTLECTNRKSSIISGKKTV